MKSKNQLRRERQKQKRLKATQPQNSKDSMLTAAKNPDHSNEQQPRSTIAILARKYDWMNETDPLYQMYHDVTSRLQKRKRDETSTISRDERTEVAEDSKLEDYGNQAKQTSSNERHKPSLADLKKLTDKPELIEWYDADAAHPEFLVRMKTLPGVVQVPPNWRHRSEIPQFGPKRAYTLPPHIVDTKIQEAWKNGRLDVDYDRMYAAFFSPDSGNDNLEFLEYGQIVDLKNRRAFKPTDPKAKTVKEKPAAPSDRLRNALGIKDNEELPWQDAVRRLGPAPGYRHVYRDDSGSINRWGYLI